MQECAYILHEVVIIVISDDTDELVCIRTLRIRQEVVGGF